MNNVMLDLETFGTRPGSVIRSIGAVMFDPRGTGHGAEFYVNVDEQSCLDAGLTKDDSTVAWWAKQSKQAQNALLVDPRPLPEARDAFYKFCSKNAAVFAWSQGATFDIVLIDCASYAVDKRGTPWKFWDSRCTRTAYDMGQFNPFTVKRAGTYHNALDDAKHQVVCVQRAYANVTVRSAR